jgi:protocatechuate 3,4-dioxygenase alpha subunit
VTGDGGITPSQTIGPFLSVGLVFDGDSYVVGADDPDGMWLRGVVRDGDGAVVQDALIETWQADQHGAYGGAFRGFGRCPTDDDGEYAIRTRKPGAVSAPSGGRQAPHIAVTVFARGLLHQVLTRIYFADEAAANAADPVLAAVPADRRHTLLAEPTGDGYRFDIRLQGTHETVFFTS